MPWLLFHKHTDETHEGWISLPLVVHSESGLSFLPRILNGKMDGTWMRIGGDQGRGGLWIEEQFVDICKALGVKLPAEEADDARYQNRPR